MEQNEVIDPSQNPTPPPALEPPAGSVPPAAPVSEPAAPVAPPPVDLEAQRQSRLDKRFAKLTGEIHQLRGQNAALLQMVGPQGQQPAQAPAAVGKPARDAFQTDEDYQEALIDWKVDQRTAQREQVSTRQQAVSRFVVQQQTAASEYPDWDEVMEDALQLPASPAVEEAILYSDIGPDLQYHLAKNPQEAMRLNSLPPILAARQIGIIEARIAAEKAARKAAPPAPPAVSKAPDPITPVGGRGVVEVDPSKMSDKEFAEWRRKSPGQAHRYKR
jgi:hypothetical protein